MKERTFSIAMFVLFLGLSLGAASIGGLATDLSVDTWYRQLEKPWWTPPGSLIGAVWGVLYPLMAVAVWTAFRKWREMDVFEAILLWCMQLMFNAGWSVCFFGLRNPGLAFVEIVLLWLLIGATVFAFARTSMAAALLMTPYYAWVTFAAYLNFTIWQLNLPA